MRPWQGPSTEFLLHGQIAKWTQQADAQTQTVWGIEYDPADQLASVIKSNGVTGAILNRFVYAYDKAGNRMSEYTSSDDAVSPSTSVMGGTFNNLNQLTAVSGGGKTRVRGSLNELGTVSVDGTPAPVDSRNTNFVGYTQLSLGSNVFSVVATDYSNNKRTNNYQLVLTNNGTAQTLTYDLNGNLASAVSATSTNAYEWDAQDRLVAVNIGTNRSEFSYDGVGRRVGIVEKQNGTAVSTNKFLWCGSGLSEQRDASGGSVTRRLLGSGEQISGANYFYTYDHLGSIREMVDGSGTIRARYDYDPYGRKTKLSGDLEAAFGFTGHYFHAASGLHLALFRAYDAQAARWLSRDPIEEEGGLNLYMYVGGNPVNSIDPLGLAFGDYWDVQATHDYYENVMNTSESGFARTGAEVGNFLLDAFGLLNAQNAGKQAGMGNTGCAIRKGALAVIKGVSTALSLNAARSFGLAKGMWRPSSFKGVVQDGINMSHFISKNWLKKKGLIWLDGAWNLEPLWHPIHAMADPARMRPMTQAFKLANEAFSPLTAMWVRLPAWMKIGLFQGSNVGARAAGGCE